MAKPCIYITAFGGFAGIPADENSSHVVLQRLLAAAHGPDRPYNLLGGETLVVSAAAVRAWHAGTWPRLRAAAAAGGGGPLVVLHLGLARTAGGVRLEAAAYNEARFTDADEEGWRPAGERVDAALPLGARLAARLPLDAVCAALRARCPAARVGVSDDPGRYVCNWAYWLTLRRLQEEGAEGAPALALFVHLPPLHRVAEALQVEVLNVLLEELAAVAGGGVSGGGVSGTATT